MPNITGPVPEWRSSSPNKNMPRQERLRSNPRIERTSANVTKKVAATLNITPSIETKVIPATRPKPTAITQSASSPIKVKAAKQDRTYNHILDILQNKIKNKDQFKEVIRKLYEFSKTYNPYEGLGDQHLSTLEEIKKDILASGNAKQFGKVIDYYNELKTIFILEPKIMEHKIIMIWLGLAKEIEEQFLTTHEIITGDPSVDDPRILSLSSLLIFLREDPNNVPIRSTTILNILDFFAPNTFKVVASREEAAERAKNSQKKFVYLFPLPNNTTEIGGITLSNNGSTKQITIDVNQEGFLEKVQSEFLLNKESEIIAVSSRKSKSVEESIPQKISFKTTESKPAEEIEEYSPISDIAENVNDSPEFKKTFTKIVQLADKRQSMKVLEEDQQDLIISFGSNAPNENKIAEIKNEISKTGNQEVIARIVNYIDALDTTTFVEPALQEGITMIKQQIARQFMNICLPPKERTGPLLNKRAEKIANLLPYLSRGVSKAIVEPDIVLSICKHYPTEFKAASSRNEAFQMAQESEKVHFYLFALANRKNELGVVIRMQDGSIRETSVNVNERGFLSNLKSHYS